MSLGTLTAVVDAETRGFVQGMANAAARMETFAREAKKLARDVAQVSLGMIAFAAAAVRMAAGADAGVNRAVTALKGELMALAIQIAHLVLPAVHQLTQLIGRLADFFAGLSPETKKQISDWSLYALEAGAAALVLGKVFTAAKAAAAVLEGLSVILGAIGVGTLGVVLVVLIAIAAAVAVVHKAWRENWGGIQEKTATVINAISGYWQAFKTWLSGSFFDWFIDKWAAIEKSIAHAMNFLRNPLNEAERRQQNNIDDETVDKWAAGAKGGSFSRQLELAYVKAKEVVEAGAAEWKIILHEIGGAVRSIMPSSSGRRAQHAPVYDTEGWDQWDKSAESWKGEHKYRDSDYKEFQRAGSRLGEDDEQGRTTAAVALQYDRELENRKAFNDQMDKLSAGIMNGVQMLLGRLGDLGAVMSSAIQGFQSGGIWGMIIAVFVELLSRFDRFQELIDIGNGQIAQLLEQLKPALNMIVDVLREFMGASGYLTQVVGTILSPILKIIAKAFKQLVPIIEVVATALSGLGPIFDLLGEVLGPILEAVSYIFRFVGSTILGAMVALLYLWQAVLSIAYEISKAANWGKGDAGIKAQMDANQAKINDVSKQLTSLWETGTTGIAKASADASEKIGKMGDKAEEVTEQIANMPSGYKIALTRFNATLATATTAAFDGFAQLMDERAERNSYTQSGSAFTHFKK